MEIEQTMIVSGTEGSNILLINGHTKYSEDGANTQIDFALAGAQFFGVKWMCGGAPEL